MGRGDFRKQLTDKMVAFMEENDGLPWQKGWSDVSVRPFNPGSGVKYRGGNVLSLIHAALERGSDDPRWMTFKQAKAKGMSVRRGAKSVLVEYWDWDERKKPDQNAEVAEDGKDAQSDGQVPSRARKPLLFYAAVFNAADIDGLPPLKKDVSWQPNLLAEKLLAATGAQIENRVLVKTGGGGIVANSAHYDQIRDRIVLPPRSSFGSESDWYATPLHELAHWTGHSTRLDRLAADVKFGSPEYAREELRAEIASMFLSSMLGVEGDVLNHARYTAHWAQVLKKDKHELFRAAKDAEAIVEHIFEYAPEIKQVCEARYDANVIKEAVKKPRNDIEPMPNFIPASARKPVAPAEPSAPVVTAPAGVGRADPRWPAFETTVRSEAVKYGIPEGTVVDTLALLESQFSEVMKAAGRNGFSVDEMTDMFVRRLVEEMRVNKEREQQWSKYCDQVRVASDGLLTPENVELKLQEMGEQYQQILLTSGQEGWEDERIEDAVRGIIYGELGRRPITAQYIREQFLSGAQPERAADDDDFLLAPTGLGGGFDDEPLLMPFSSGIAFDDAVPASALAAVEDDQSPSP